MLKEIITSKAGFPFYTDYWKSYFCKMTGDQVKECMRIIFNFNETFEILKTEDLAIEMVATTIIGNIKRDAEKRTKQILANKENGDKGGRPRKNNEKPTKPKLEKTQVIPEFINKELWDSYVEMRIKKKKPLTEKAIKLTIDDLQKFENQKQGFANLSLENSIKASWQGVFEPKQDFNSQKPKTSFGSQLNKF